MAIAILSGYCCLTYTLFSQTAGNGLYNYSYVLCVVSQNNSFPLCMYTFISYCDRIYP